MGFRVGIGTGIGPVRVGASTRIGGRRRGSSGSGCGLVFLAAIVIGGIGWLASHAWPVLVVLVAIPVGVFLTRRYPALQTQNLFRSRKKRRDDAEVAAITQHLLNHANRPTSPSSGTRPTTQPGPVPTYVARETYPSRTAPPAPPRATPPAPPAQGQHPRTGRVAGVADDEYQWMRQRRE